MAASKVMTLRIEPELLDALRTLARAERRSVSSQVLHLVRRELAGTARPRKPLPTRGWLKHLEAPNELAAFREVRRTLSASLSTRGRLRRAKAS